MLVIQEQVPLAPYTTFRVGGPARFFVAAKKVEEAQEAASWASEKGVAVFVLGGGSNVLVSDKGFEGLVVKMELGKWEISPPHPWPSPNEGRGNLTAPSPPSPAYRTGRLSQRGERESQLVEVYAEAGVVTAQLAGECARAGLSGFTWAVGVPGTIGGAVRGNAGASGGEMKDVIESVKVLSTKATEQLSDATIANCKLQIADLSNTECKFGYRQSIFKERPEFVVLSATLALTKGDPKEETEKMKQTLAYRNATQPKEWPNSGCVFKNIDFSISEVSNPHPSPLPASRTRQGEGIFSNADDLLQKGVPEEFLKKGRIPAGWLVQRAGGQALAVGGARVSDRHCNFLQNAGNASAEDIRTLIAAVKGQVYTRFGIALEEEVQYVGF